MLIDHIVVRRLVLSLLVISLMYSLYKRLSDNDQEQRYHTVPKTLVLYTEENLKELKLLAEKTPKKKRRLLLAVLGSVFDVSKGKQHYDPEDGAYGVFAFRDATRAFVTGDFQNDLNDDCRDFDAEQYAQAVRWRDFYMKSKKYHLVGRIIGRYYDQDGDPKAPLILAETQASLHKEGQEGKMDVPLCDISWNNQDGGWVECPQGLLPRRVPWNLNDGKVKEKCACIQKNKLSDAQKQYPGCDPESSRCRTPNQNNGKGASTVSSRSEL